MNHFLPGMDDLAAEQLLKEQTRFWWSALRIAAKRGGTFLMARMIYKGRYGEFPPQNFPCMNQGVNSNVAQTYPKLAPRKP